MAVEQSSDPPARRLPMNPAPACRARACLHRVACRAATATRFLWARRSSFRFSIFFLHQPTPPRAASLQEANAMTIGCSGADAATGRRRRAMRRRAGFRKQGRGGRQRRCRVRGWACIASVPSPLASQGYSWPTWCGVCTAGQESLRYQQYPDNLMSNGSHGYEGKRPSGRLWFLWSSHALEASASDRKMPAVDWMAIAVNFPWYTLLLSFAVAVGAILLLMPLARRTGWIDKPDIRKTHEGEIPLIGGWALMLAMVVAQFTGPPEVACHARLLGRRAVLFFSCPGRRPLIRCARAIGWWCSSLRRSSACRSADRYCTMSAISSAPVTCRHGGSSCRSRSSARWR